MTDEGHRPEDPLGGIPPEFFQDRSLLVVANGVVNAGVVNGGQRYTKVAEAAADEMTAPTRQGPVRSQDLRRARRVFVPPSGHAEGLGALESGLLLLVGAQGTGRRTAALNMLAHGHEKPALVQLDGHTDLVNWRPAPDGVHGYLVMDPADPRALRPWDLANLEQRVTGAGARLVIVLVEEPGLVRALRREHGLPVFRHVPPDPRDVFTAHLTELCPDPGERERRMKALGFDVLSGLLPAELPPGHAVSVAEAVVRSAPEGEPCPGSVTSALAEAEAAELLAVSEEDTEALTLLLSVCAHSGLETSTVMDRAGALRHLLVTGPNPDAVSTVLPRRLQPGVLRRIRTRPVTTPHGDERVELLWPAVAEAVWDLVCGEHPELLPSLHRWLAMTAEGDEEISQAARVLSGLAARTGGRTLTLMGDVVVPLAPSGPGVAARCLANGLRHTEAGAVARQVLGEWSMAAEPALRTAVAHACGWAGEALASEDVLELLQRVVDRSDTVETPTCAAVVTALARLFSAGGPEDRRTYVRRLIAWSRGEDVVGRLATRASSALLHADPAWFGEQLRSDGEDADAVLELLVRALNEARSFYAMRDALLGWCSATEQGLTPRPPLEKLFARLVDTRQPGALRLLLSIERSGDATPGRDLAERALAAWHSKNVSKEGTS
ncbi:hypothetical protein [Streptomyces sp. JJ38]|uniref:hypothetical protein n=1 Tax=Streptomyces sp. JJ38 TaxID=2738128 RepID=UPI001C575CA7|nr:hypothetical protein [Streptomyces sp. JJ38]MBW1595628.1 hypothetical protein [Streptomyces sp. JJ38]